jgi:hypothetical protein
MRIPLGIGESVVTPASMRYIGRNFVEKERGPGHRRLYVRTKYGPAIGAPLAASWSRATDGGGCLVCWDSVACCG